MSAPQIGLSDPTFDTATVAGGTSPTGSLVFKLFGPGDSTCNAAPAYISPAQNVSGDGQYPSPSFVPTQQGTYSWQVLYSGDSNNAAVTTACGDPAETVTVGAFNPNGYRLVANEGGIFDFGLNFNGSLANNHLNAPIVGIANAPGINGYVMAGGDGGVFALGGAELRGPAPGGQTLPLPDLGHRGTAGGERHRPWPRTARSTTTAAHRRCPRCPCPPGRISSAWPRPKTAGGRG